MLRVSTVPIEQLAARAGPLALVRTYGIDAREVYNSEGTGSMGMVNAGFGRE
jgi:hypothetical protein